MPMPINTVLRRTKRKATASGPMPTTPKSLTSRCPAVRTQPVSRSTSYLMLMYLPWLYAACSLTLAIAAFLHWRRTRHWCLLVLSTGSLLVTGGLVAGQITHIVIFFGPHTNHVAEAIEFYANLQTIFACVSGFGALLALVGGVGAIFWGDTD